MGMKETDYVSKANTISVILHGFDGSSEEISRNYHIGGIIDFQVKLTASNTLILPNISCSGFDIYNYKIYFYISVRFLALGEDDNLEYTMKLCSKSLDIVDKCFTNDDGRWHVICIRKVAISKFDIKVQMGLILGPCAFSILHNDSNLTDFELRGDDGSIHVHRAVLAASSPVLRTMLEGTWKETTEGLVDVAGTSILTLQQLKDYMYQHILPETGFEHLILLASCYGMPELEQCCVFKLVSNLTEENAVDLLQLALNHKIKKLCFALLKCINGAVKIDKIKF